MLTKELKSIIDNHSPLLDKGGHFENSLDKYQVFYLYRHFRYLIGKFGDLENLLSHYSDLDYYNSVIVDSFSNFDYSEYEKMYESFKKRVHRLDKKVKKYLSMYKYFYFVTLTFNNDNYEGRETPTIELRRQLNDTELKTKVYIANRDIGQKTERFHLHVLVFSNDVMNSLSWNKGFYKIDLINNSDRLNVVKYISKLTYHTLKIQDHYQLIYNNPLD